MNPAAPTVALLPDAARAPAPQPPAVSVDGLAVSIKRTGVEIVRATTLDVAPGEILGLVGESGSGKSTLALALLWHAGRGLVISGGDVRLRQRSLRALGPAELRQCRGREVSYVPQDPARSLNPGFRIGDQLREVLRGHAGPELGDRRMAEVLREVSLPDDAAFLARFPHQLSGGQQQRVALAMAFACRPALVVLDEPTTGLDVQTQSRVLATVRMMCRRNRAAALYVSHDLAVVAAIADRIAVIYAGRIVELAATRQVVDASLHPYTRGLLAAAPDPRRRQALTGIAGQAPSPRDRPPGCSFAPRCTLAEARCRERDPVSDEPQPGHTVRCWRAGERPAAVAPAQGVASAASVGRRGSLVVRDLSAHHGRTPALHGISLAVPAGACVAVVGESGSGKTTLARCIAGMHQVYHGSVALGAATLAGSARQRPRDARRAIQYVFQNPYSALNPRRTMAEVLGQWLDVLGSGSAADRRRLIGAALAKVGLGEDVLPRYADELSGGQQQRVALARALVCEPSFLVCDEVTSALDVSVQASVMALLERLRSDEGLGLLFITHNLALVRSIADHVLVMRAGRVVEAGVTEAIFAAAAHDYTRDLLRLTPSLPGAA